MSFRTIAGWIHVHVARVFGRVQGTVLHSRCGKDSNLVRTPESVRLVAGTYMTGSRR